MREGGGNCLKYLKRVWNRKEGRGLKDFKKGGKLGQEVVVLKKGGDWNPLTNYDYQADHISSNLLKAVFHKFLWSTLEYFVPFIHISLLAKPICLNLFSKIYFQKFVFTNTSQKMKFSLNGFFSKCDQIRSFPITRRI